MATPWVLVFLGPLLASFLTRAHWHGQPTLNFEAIIMVCWFLRYSETLTDFRLSRLLWAHLGSLDRLVDILWVEIVLLGDLIELFFQTLLSSVLAHQILFTVALVSRRGHFLA